MTTPANINEWLPFDDVYSAFAEANPMLGLTPGIHSAIRVRARYGPQLVAAGAALKLPNRRWLANAERFGPALFASMTGAYQGIIDRAQVRQ